MDIKKCKYKIVVDSSSDLSKDYIKDSNIGFEVVPLTIRANCVDFVDNENLNVDEMLDAMHASKTKSTTSCPSSEYFKKSYEEAEYVICITISSKISGTPIEGYLKEIDINEDFAKDELNTELNVIMEKIKDKFPVQYLIHL